MQIYVSKSINIHIQTSRKEKVVNKKNYLNLIEIKWFFYYFTFKTLKLLKTLDATLNYYYYSDINSQLILNCCLATDTLNNVGGGQC